MVDNRTPAWERLIKLAEAQGRVSVQANCTIGQALVLMRERAALTAHTLDEIADAVGKHRMCFS